MSHPLPDRELALNSRAARPEATLRHEKEEAMTDTRTSMPPVIPRETLFGNPEKAQPRLSPDGKRLAYLAPLNGVLNVFVGPADAPVGGDEFVPVTRDEVRGIRLYFWS